MGKIKDISKIKLIVTDFDGVWTDNKVLHFDNGTEAVLRSKSDSIGIDILEKSGFYNKKEYKKENHKIDIIILSNEISSVVESVSKKIKVKNIAFVDNKKVALIEEIKNRGLNLSEVLFIGNDINDIACIKMVGIGVAVNDATIEVKNIADYVTKKNGGDGAIREIIDVLIKSKT